MEEKILMRRLFKNEVVHHIDGNRSNNSVENLAVIDNREHAKMHANINHSKRKRSKNGRFS